MTSWEWLVITYKNGCHFFHCNFAMPRDPTTSGNTQPGPSVETEARPMSSPRTSVASVYTATPVAFIPGENQGKTRSKLPSGKRSHIIYGKSPCYEWVNENELSMAIENIANCSFTRGYISTSIDLCWNWFLLGFSTQITNQFLSLFFFNWGSINGMAQTPTRSCYWLYLLKLYPTY